MYLFRNISDNMLIYINMSDIYTAQQKSLK